MKKLFWLILALLALGYWFWVYRTSAATNPQYVSVIMACSNYESECGREFKHILGLYNYQVCKEIVEDQCGQWYDPVELHYVFNTLPGWKD